MEKKFDKFFIANVRRTYQIISPAIKEKQKLQKEVAEKQKRIGELDQKIEVFDAPIKEATGGYGVESLIQKVVIDTGKVTSDGKPVKITKLNLRYPETIIPPTEGTVDSEDPKEDSDIKKSEPEVTPEQHSELDLDNIIIN